VATNSDFLTTIRSTIEASISVKQSILADERLLGEISALGQLCIAAYRRGNRVILAGNGGSAADAQHLAAEFVSRFEFDRPGLPALALTTDTSMLTAIGNDYGYEQLFKRQLQANGRSGDVFIGISTSGNSKNVLAALECCREQQITPVGLAGTQGRIGELCELCIRVPSINTARIQEAHIMIGHIVCGIVESALFSALRA
jgi:D-sedoheptulose 7-phosphate isomerase